MKKIIICLAVVASTTAGYLTYKTNANAGTISMFGVIEALTQGEETNYGCRVTCPNGAVIDCFSKPCSAGDNYVDCGGRRVSC